MDSKKLSVLLTAIDIGSFSKAAETVGYTQSGLTHLVDGLEREVGFKIINRTHYGISLTDEGQQIMPLIRTFLRASTELDNKIQSITEDKRETIRIAAYASIAMQWMPEILYRFRRLCPEVSVDLRMVDNAVEPFELLESGSTDVAFASRHDFFGIDWTSLYDEKLYAILPKSFPVGESNTFDVRNFSGVDFLMPYGKFDVTVKDALGDVKPNFIPARVDDETVIRMVGKGLGVTVMSELMIRGRTDDVICLPLSSNARRELGMALNKGASVTESIQKLKDCVLKFVSEL